MFESIELKGANFKLYADFRNSEIGKLDISTSEGFILPTLVEGRMDFREAVISEAHFQDITFKQDVDFSDVQFGDLTEEKKLAVVFRFINFESNAYFTRTIFSANTTFERINFEKDADFTYAVFSNRHNLIFSYPKFQNLRLSWKQLPGSPQYWANDTNNEAEAIRQKIQPLKQVLKIFETSFRNQKQLSDANEAYYHMMDAEISENREGKAFMGFLPAQLHMIIWKITCGYGTRIYRILGWCILFNLFFTTIYFMKGQLQPAAQKDDTFKMRLFDFPRLYLGQYTAEQRNYSLSAYLSALKLSSVILFKIGSRDTTISGNILGIDYKYIVWIEWLLGFYLLAALVVTLSNTVPLIHRLISGIL